MTDGVIVRSRSLGKSSDDNNEESGNRAKHRSSHHHHHHHHNHKQKSDEPEWVNDRPQQVTELNGKHTEDAPKESNHSENGGTHDRQYG